MSESFDAMMRRHERAEKQESRAMHKLTVQLESIEREMERIRSHNHCPEHAPSAWRIQMSLLRVWRARRDRVQARIMRLMEHQRY